MNFSVQISIHVLPNKAKYDFNKIVVVWEVDRW